MIVGSEKKSIVALINLNYPIRRNPLPRIGIVHSTPYRVMGRHYIYNAILVPLYTNDPNAGISIVENLVLIISSAFIKPGLCALSNFL